MSGKLPNHVPIKILVKDIYKFDKILEGKGYNWVFLQVVKPKQLIGKVNTIERNGIIVEHHVRVFTNGTITSEFELPRRKQMWEHLTTVSYSSHEKIIEFLDENSISFEVDEMLRKRYNENAIDGYPKKYWEFVEWLFVGVIFWTPLGYIWRAYYNIKQKFTYSDKTSKKVIAKA